MADFIASTVDLYPLTNLAPVLSLKSKAIFSFANVRQELKCTILFLNNPLEISASSSKSISPPSPSNDMVWSRP